MTPQADTLAKIAAHLAEHRMAMRKPKLNQP